VTELLKRTNTKKLFLPFLVFTLVVWTLAGAAQKDLEVQGKRLVSQKPLFTLTLPFESNLVDSFSQENPGRNSLTRVYFLVKAKEKQVEEMLILQIADKTNPQAGPINAASLKPYAERRSYLKGTMKKGELEVDYLIQLMAWNPDAPSLQPLIKKGFTIPRHWALQGQFLFLYQGEHAVFFRYSKDASSFGVKTSEKGGDWEKGVISRNEKRVYETFQKSFMEMMDSIQIKIQ
jgi:hypothetical protein